MAGHLSFSSITDLVALLATVDIPASVDPADVNLPGAWIAVEDITHQVTLNGTMRLAVAVYLIVPDIDPRRAMESLAPVYNRLMEVVTPDGKVTPTGVVLPDNPTPMPALRVPVYLFE